MSACYPDYIYESQRQSRCGDGQFFRINPDEILVAHDELDLPPGVPNLNWAVAMVVTMD